MAPLNSSASAHRGALLSFRSDPGEHDSPGCYDYWPDGAMLVRDGRIVAIGSAGDVLKSVPSAVSVTEHDSKLIVPGFIDTHIHYPQVDVIGSGGRNLLEWLEQYTFPAEARFGDVMYARQAAEFFLDELLDNGTTTAQVFGSVHKSSIDAFFAAAGARNLRMVAGKVLTEGPPAEIQSDPRVKEVYLGEAQHG